MEVRWKSQDMLDSPPIDILRYIPRVEIAYDYKFYAILICDL